MFNFSSAAIVTFVLVATASAQRNPAVDTKFDIVEDIAAYKKANPKLTLIPLDISGSNRVQMVYTLGTRMPGDSLVATMQDNLESSTLEDMELELKYPQTEEEEGAILTYVQLVTQQSSKQGRVYQVSGGIGSRHFHMAIVAQNTSYLNYTAEVFGL